MASIPERLAALETKVDIVDSDVKEVKKDVKTLLLRDAGGIGVLSLAQRAAPWAAVVLAGAAFAFK